MSILSSHKQHALETKQFKQLFDSHYPCLCRLLTGILGNSSAAEDLAQEAFIRLYRTPPKEFTNQKGWLTKVGTNLAYNYLRSEKNRFQRESNSHFSPPLGPDEAVIRDEEIALTREVLETLPERDRLILLLKFSEHSYSEIAQVMEVPASSVGTVLARARAKFKAQYIRLKGSDFNAL